MNHFSWSWALRSIVVLTLTSSYSILSTPEAYGQAEGESNAQCFEREARAADANLADLLFRNRAAFPPELRQSCREQRDMTRGEIRTAISSCLRNARNSGLEIENPVAHCRAITGVAPVQQAFRQCLDEGAAAPWSDADRKAFNENRDAIRDLRLAARNACQLDNTRLARRIERERNFSERVDRLRQSINAQVAINNATDLVTSAD